ncbi:unnamed protein product [Prorocentrum cordatum]|uniref:Uncharacterized protein n=1 Tax=Prorocentrum cordatum TaxID=2364126 RepID=A0ABN9Q3C0_9DINO|nr:unnamed protein product [Polarella glacialis]
MSGDEASAAATSELPGGRTAGGRRPLLAPASSLMSAPADGARGARSQSRSPRGALGPADVQGARAASSDFAAVKKLVEDELKGFLPNELIKRIQKSTNDLNARIASLQKVNERATSTKSDVEALSAGRVPSGCRPFTLAYESPFLDTERVVDLSFRLDLSGKTLREAKHEAYCAHLAIQKKLDVLLLAKQRDDLRRLTKRDYFVETCAAALSDQTSRVSGLDLDLDLDNDDGFQVSTAGVDAERLKAKATAIYAKAVARASDEKARKQQEKAKQDQAQEKLIQQMMGTSPADLFNMAVDARVIARQRVLGRAGPAGGGTIAAQAASLHTSTMAAGQSSVDRADAVRLAALSKNGTSPPGQGGGKDKGKGKGRGDPKGKSKGNGKATPSPKGESKGKSKGKGKGKSKASGKTSAGKGAGARGSARGSGRGRSAGGRRRGRGT